MRCSLFLSVALFPVLPAFAQPAVDEAPEKKQASIPLPKRMSSSIAGGSWQPLTAQERRRYFLEQALISPAVYLRAFGSAVGNHISNRPPEWGQGAEGYFHRVGDRFGRFAIQDVITHSSAAALHHEVRYVSCECTGFFPRFGRAIAMNFATLNRHGEWAPNYSFMVGSVGAESLGNLWWPERTRNKSIVVRGIGIQFGVNTAINLFREFTPEIKRTFRVRK